MSGWRLKPRLALCLADFEVLRVIRNECREYMTNFQGEITEGQQEAYFHSYDSYRTRHYIYSYRGEDVAFSVIRTTDSGTEAIVTFGIAEKWRGQGLGWDLCKMALMAAGLPIVGDRFVSNKRVAIIDDTCGYRAIGPPNEDGIEPVECPWPPPFVEMQTQQQVYDEIVRYHRYGEKES